MIVRFLGVIAIAAMVIGLTLVEPTPSGMAEARSAYQRGQFDRAIRIYERLSSAGSGEASYQLAHLYAGGTRAGGRYALAAKYFGRAATQFEPMALERDPKAMIRIVYSSLGAQIPPEGPSKPIDDYQDFPIKWALGAYLHGHIPAVFMVFHGRYQSRAASSLSSDNQVVLATLAARQDPFMAQMPFVRNVASPLSDTQIDSLAKRYTEETDPDRRRKLQNDLGLVREYSKLIWSAVDFWEETETMPNASLRERCNQGRDNLDDAMLFSSDTTLLMCIRYLQRKPISQSAWLAFLSCDIWRAQNTTDIATHAAQIFRRCLNSDEQTNPLLVWPSE